MGEKEREEGRKERGGIKGKRESRHGEQRGRGIAYFQCLYNSEAKMCTCLEQTLILSIHMAMSHLPVDMREGGDEASCNVSV